MGTGWSRSIGYDRVSLFECGFREGLAGVLNLTILGSSAVVSSGWGGLSSDELLIWEIIDSSSKAANTSSVSCASIGSVVLGIGVAAGGGIADLELRSQCSCSARLLTDIEVGHPELPKIAASQYEGSHEGVVAIVAEIQEGGSHRLCRFRGSRKARDCRT